MKIKDYIFKLLLVAGIIALCTSCGKKDDVKVYNDVSEENNYEEDGSADKTDARESGINVDGSTDASLDEVYVQLCGAVNSPGVYKLKSGTRVFEAIEAAGGVTEEADTNAVNLARPVTDEMQIYVPTKEEVSLSEEDYYWQDSEETKDSLVNINKATKKELMELPGIGESKAEAIINYRDEIGAFDDISQIMNISGIKNAAFDKIKDLIKV